MELKNRSFLKLLDYTPAEIGQLLELAADLKAKKKAGIRHDQLRGKNIALIFEKTSTRTRCSFEVAAHDLGMEVTYLDPSGSQIGKKESIADTARVLGRMFDGIEFRGFEQATVEGLAKYSGVPVWNGLTDDWHPTQMIADFMTIKEVFGTLENKKLTYVGDGRNNMANSLLVTSAILGIDCSIGAPADLQPAKEVQDIAHKLAEKSGSTLEITDDVAQAVKDADVLYTDVWISMGEDIDVKARVEKLLPYQINDSLLEKTGKSETIVMHCLPAFHDKQTKMGKKLCDQFGVEALEITDDVFNGKHSVVFQEGENRLHSIKAIMAATLGDLFIPDYLFE